MLQITDNPDSVKAILDHLQPLPLTGNDYKRLAEIFAQGTASLLDVAERETFGTGLAQLVRSAPSNRHSPPPTYWWEKAPPAQAALN